MHIESVERIAQIENSFLNCKNCLSSTTKFSLYNLMPVFLFVLQTPKLSGTGWGGELCIWWEYISTRISGYFNWHRNIDG